jgi:hypothetical protein
MPDKTRDDGVDQGTHHANLEISLPIPVAGQPIRISMMDRRASGSEFRLRIT